jgi:hypothetical protein
LYSRYYHRSIKHEVLDTQWLLTQCVRLQWSRQCNLDIDPRCKAKRESPRSKSSCLLHPSSNLSIRPRPNCRPRKRIRRLPVIDIESNSFLVPPIQLRPRHAPGRLDTASPTNLEIHTLWIQLRAIIVLGAAECDNLVSDDVVAGREVERYHGRGSEVGFDESVSDLEIVGVRG